MSDEPKITFAAPPSQIAMINGLPLTVSPATADILAAVHFGHCQAIEMFRTVTQPPAPTPATIQNFPGGMEEDDLATGPLLDMSTLWQMSPVAREAILAAHGLQVMPPEPARVDPVHEEVARATGLKPLTEE